MIDMLQPYRAPDHGAAQLLRTLRDLSNYDKHRLLNPILYAIDAAGDQSLRFPRNSDAGDIVGYKAATFTAEGEAEILAVGFSCPGNDPQVDMEHQPPVEIGFGESHVRARDLSLLGVNVGEIIDVFSRYF